MLQGADAWVAVHAVSSAEGGLLDPDDRLADVADDRETLTASFEEAGNDHAGGHTGGDGASGSSVGTGSPDIFHVSTVWLEIGGQTVGCGPHDTKSFGTVSVGLE